MTRTYVDDGSRGINLPPEQQAWTGTGFDVCRSCGFADCPNAGNALGSCPRWDES